MTLPNHILEILNKKSTDVLEGSKSNCFWATQYFFNSTSLPPQTLNGNEILKFIAENFIQVEMPMENDVFILWSRRDSLVSPNQVDVQYLSTYPEGFPFGLIIEHSGVFLKEKQVFQKASPHGDDRFEVLSTEQAFAPYENLPWVRKTFHRKK